MKLHLVSSKEDLEVITNLLKKCLKIDHEQLRHATKGRKTVRGVRREQLVGGGGGV